VFLEKSVVLISIKPQFVDKILSGHKLVEFRKFFPEKVSFVVIYSTSPIQKIVGMLRVKEVLKLPVSELWGNYGHVGGVAREDFFYYFKNKDIAYGVVIDKVWKAEPFLDPKLLLRKFTPPQSFIYLSESQFMYLSSIFNVIQ